MNFSSGAEINGWLIKKRPGIKQLKSSGSEVMGVYGLEFREASMQYKIVMNSSNVQVCVTIVLTINDLDVFTVSFQSPSK